MENYLKIAKTALSSRNHAEAERYANRVIEIASSNYEAWLIKGKAAGWQSTTANPRFSECVSSFATALTHAPQDQKKKLMADIKTEIANLSRSLITLRAERFVKWPDKEEGNGFLSDLSTIVQTVRDFLSNGIPISIEDILSPIIIIIDDATKKAYHTTIYPDYKSDEYPYPDEHDWRRYVARIDYCIQLLEQSVVLCKKDRDVNLQMWKDLIEFQNCAINSVSMDFTYVGDEKVYYQKYRLADEARANRRKKIAKYQAEINSIESQIKAEEEKKQAEKNALKSKKKSDFWSVHSEEKEYLENELRKAERERDKLIASGTGYTKCNMLGEYVKGIKEVLSAERDATAFSYADRNMLTCGKNFWSKLSALDEYDEYLDKNPILKQAEVLAERHKQIKLTKYELKVNWDDSSRKARNWFIVGLITTVALIVEAILLSSLILWLLVLVCACFSFVYGCFCIPYIVVSFRARRLKPVYKRDVKAYNASVDRMNAVPKYTGQMNKTLKFAIAHEWTPRIPPKIEE